MLDLRKSDALLAVIDFGSFDLAATHLKLTPSAVSQRISQMENDLGFPLVLRNKPARATPAGHRVVQYLRRLRQLEEELRFDLESKDQPVSIALAVNNDTLCTWLLPCLAEFLISENILLKITADDQEHTFTLLEQGLALAGISSNPVPMRACNAEPLGSMRYHLMASPEFARRWFPTGLTREALRQAPLMVFDRKDELQSKFLLREFGLPPDSYPFHHIPASDPYVLAIRLGLGYGLVPEFQNNGTNSELVQLAEDKPVDVPLYWHCWRIQSPKLERLSEKIIGEARKILRNVQ
jgi:LysR family transcriptional regulator, chromosome initiation inhibitor